MGFDYLNKLRTKRVSDFDRRVVLAEEADREFNLKHQPISFLYWLAFMKTASVRNENGALAAGQFDKVVFHIMTFQLFISKPAVSQKTPGFSDM